MLQACISAMGPAATRTEIPILNSFYSKRLLADKFAGGF